MRGTPLYITFLNYLGGFEYFFFTAEKEHQIEITETGTTRENIFPNYPKSWGENADTITKKTYTNANNKVVVRSQLLTADQREVLKYIKVSPVVQIVYSRTNRRTVIVDSDSFKIYDEGEKTFSIQFTITYTDEIPAQRL